MTVFTTIALGLASLTAAGQALLGTIVSNASGLFVPGSAIVSNLFLIPDSGTTTAPGVYLADETTPIKTWPTTPGVEHCEGGTGAVLCSIMLKLTGSGGHQNNNAGSFVCATATCSDIRAIAMTEAVPKASERLFGGWTTTPGTASGSQIFNRYAASSGATIIGSGSYVQGGANPVNVEKDAPPGSTIKFVWSLGDGTEDYRSYKAAVYLTYRKYYRP